jgi:ribonuclease HIII
VDVCDRRSQAENLLEQMAIPPPAPVAISRAPLRNEALVALGFDEIGHGRSYTAIGAAGGVVEMANPRDKLFR